MKQAGQVRHLSLALNATVELSLSEIPLVNNTWASVLSTQFPCLESLALQNDRASEEDQLRFSKASRETLRLLTIENLHMLSSTAEPTTHPGRKSSSIHRFLWELRNAVNLSEIELDGDFHDDIWAISAFPIPGDDCLNTRFQDYVCHRREQFPLVGLEKLSDKQIYHALSKEKADRQYLGDWIAKWHEDLDKRHGNDNSWHLYRVDGDAEAMEE